MSGIRVGSRLEQLEALATQVQQEIAVERRRLIVEEGFRFTPRVAPPPRPGLAATDTAAHSRMDDLGVTPRQVKEWAVRAGLLEAVVRGRVARWIVEAYAETHS